MQSGANAAYLLLVVSLRDSVLIVFYVKKVQEI